jgi:hypothetical protein
VIERIQKGYPDLNMNTRRGLALGLFGGKVFSETFGVDFTELDNGVRTEIFERLRACALYHPNRSVGQTLVNMLWGDEYAIDWHAADTYVAKHGRYRGRAVNYEVKTLPGVIATALSAAEAHAIIATAREDLASVEDDLAALEAKANSIRDAALSLPPSEAEDALILASGTFRSIARQKEEQRLAQLDKTLPAQPETTLIREAAQAYVLKNCNRNSVLLRYFLSGGDSAAALVSIKSAKPNGTSCEVNAGVQLYALNVSSVTSANCSEGDPATCTFTARVSCRSRINPEFGFETNLANIDPVCPVVQLPQYTLQGEFRRNSPSRWTATAVE